MHLVKNALHDEVMTRIEMDDVSPSDQPWYCGMVMGLLMANLLTQEEHDWLVNEITQMFEAYYK